MLKKLVSNIYDAFEFSRLFVFDFYIFICKNFIAFYYQSDFPFLSTFLQGEAVDLIETGKAPCIVQPEEGATYDAMIKKDKVQVRKLVS